MAAGLGAEASQAVFRAVLQAMARPGEIFRIPPSVAPDIPTALLPVLALADLSVPVCVLSADPRWAALAVHETGATIGSPGRARLVAALDGLEPSQLRVLATGSPAAPEQGAQVFVAVSGFGGPGGPGLSGPGIAGERTLPVRGLPGGFWAARDELVRDFPAGIDLVFLAPDGQLSAVPRSTSAIDGAER